MHHGFRATVQLEGEPRPLPPAVGGCAHGSGRMDERRQDQTVVSSGRSGTFQPISSHPR